MALLQCMCRGLAALSLSRPLQLTAAPVVPGRGRLNNARVEDRETAESLQQRSTRGEGPVRKGKGTDGEFNNKEA